MSSITSATASSSSYTHSIETKIITQVSKGELDNAFELLKILPESETSLIINKIGAMTSELVEKVTVAQVAAFAKKVFIVLGNSTLFTTLFTYSIQNESSVESIVKLGCELATMDIFPSSLNTIGFSAEAVKNCMVIAETIKNLVDENYFTKAKTLLNNLPEGSHCQSESIDYIFYGLMDKEGLQSAEQFAYQVSDLYLKEQLLCHLIERLKQNHQLDKAKQVLKKLSIPKNIEEQTCNIAIKYTLSSIDLTDVYALIESLPDLSYEKQKVWRTMAVRYAAIDQLEEALNVLSKITHSDLHDHAILGIIEAIVMQEKYDQFVQVATLSEQIINKEEKVKAQVMIPGELARIGNYQGAIAELYKQFDTKTIKEVVSQIVDLIIKSQGIEEAYKFAEAFEDVSIKEIIENFIGNHEYFVNW